MVVVDVWMPVQLAFNSSDYFFLLNPMIESHLNDYIISRAEREFRVMFVSFWSHFT